MIVKCKCKNKGQDKLHGKDKRVANATTKGLYRCTVCSKEHIFNKEKKK